MIPTGDANIAVTLGGTEGNRGAMQLVAGTSRFFDLPHAIDNTKWHRVTATVTTRGKSASIAFELDGKPVEKWSGPARQLRTSGMWRPGSASLLGVGAMHSTVTFRAVQLRMLSGQPRILRNR